MKTLAIILGTRPEAIKLLPLYLYINENKADLGYEAVLVSTGQHKEMLDQIFNFFEVKPDFELSCMIPGQTLAQLTSLVISELDLFLRNNKIEVVFVQGDTTTAFVGGLVGFYNKVKVAHVEAGLRTYDKDSPFPEEVNRQMISTFADFNFVPTAFSYDNLEREKRKNIHLVGNTVIDSLLMCVSILENKEEDYLEKFSSVLSPSGNVLITAHRRENHGDAFKSICEAILTLAKQNPSFNFIYPVHLNPNIKGVADKLLYGQDNILLLPPLPYDELVFIMKKSKLILTDSGGIQEEAPTLNIPILVLRESTERMEGVDAGCAVLVGTGKEDIIKKFNEILSNKEVYHRMSTTPNPYGSGNSSELIAQVISKEING